MKREWILVFNPDNGSIYSVDLSVKEGYIHREYPYAQWNQDIWDAALHELYCHSKPPLVCPECGSDEYQSECCNTCGYKSAWASVPGN
jgi:hypothetical protein